MIPIICPRCLPDDFHSDNSIAALEFRDDGRYVVTCPNGHKSVMILQQQKFEVLFEIGGYAIIDGYYREAVSSFTSSLERFYEFVMMAILLDKGISPDTFKQTWKLIERQSPRQLGAFIFIYLAEFGVPPTLLSRSKMDFRDEVVHQGKIPSREEALKYGQAILDVVRPILKQISIKFPKGVQQTVFQHLHDCRSSTDDACPVSTMGISTILSLSVATPGYDERSLEEALKDLKRKKLILKISTE